MSLSTVIAATGIAASLVAGIGQALLARRKADRERRQLAWGAFSSLGLGLVLLLDLAR